MTYKKENLPSKRGGINRSIRKGVKTAIIRLSDIVTSLDCKRNIPITQTQYTKNGKL